MSYRIKNRNRMVGEFMFIQILPIFLLILRIAQ